MVATEASATFSSMSLLSNKKVPFGRSLGGLPLLKISCRRQSCETAGSSYKVVSFGVFAVSGDWSISSGPGGPEGSEGGFIVYLLDDVVTVLLKHCRSCKLCPGGIPKYSGGMWERKPRLSIINQN